MMWNMNLVNIANFIIIKHNMKTVKHQKLNKRPPPPTLKSLNANEWMNDWIGKKAKSKYNLEN